MNETLEKYYEEDWLIKQRHPVLPLTIWNYSRKCVWEKHWDDITISCRGLVVDDDGKIVSRCFKKFLIFGSQIHLKFRTNRLKLPKKWMAS